jgi:hypothetical protein
MTLRQLFNSSIDREHLLVVCLVLLVGLAGCSGLGGQDGTATATSTPTDTATPGNDTSSIEDVDVGPNEVIGPTAETLTGVDTYSLSGTLNITVSSPNGEQTVQSRLNTSVNRGAMRLKSTQTTRGITSETYFVDGTLYQRSPQLAQQYNSEWIKIDASNESADQFNRNDELAAHLVMLQNASVTVVGAEDVRGERAYRLDVAVNETALNAFYGFSNASARINSVNTTVWVGTESNRVLRASGTITQQATIQGQSVDTTIIYDEYFDYGDVSISLPDAASSAVEINQTTGLGV